MNTPVWVSMNSVTYPSLAVTVIPDLGRPTPGRAGAIPEQFLRTAQEWSDPAGAGSPIATVHCELRVRCEGGRGSEMTAGRYLRRLR